MKVDHGDAGLAAVLAQMSTDLIKVVAVSGKNESVKVMVEEWRIKGELLQELDSLRSRVAELEAELVRKKGPVESKDSGPSFLQFFDAADEGMLLIDAENRQFVVGNKAICQMLGYDAEEITSLGVVDIHPKEDLDYVVGQFERQARGEMVLTKNIPVVKKDGSVLYADINSFPISFDGRTYMMSIFREIPARKGKSILQEIIYSGSYTGKPLTASEIRIFELIANGMSNKEIARLLHRSVRTIEWHRRHIMQKLGVDSLADLVKRAASMGLVDLPAKQKLDKYSAPD